MSLSKFSIRHPIPVIVFFLVVVIIGVVSFSRLSVDLFPALQFPVALVSTSYSGAGPQEIESLITRPIEEILGTVNNVKSIRSSSREGFSMVIVEFNWGTDMDFAGLQMREKIDQIKRLLPEDAEQPLVFKLDPSAQPIMTVGLSGGRDLAELKRTVEKTIKPRLERLDGVASVAIQGGAAREIQVMVDPARLAAAGISINQILGSLRSENINLPGGNISERQLNFLIRTLGQFSSVDEVRDLHVAGPAGTYYRLGEVAEVTDGFAESVQKTWMNGRPSIGLAIQKQTTANTVQVARTVNAELEKISAELGDLQVKIMTDQSVFINRSIKNVAESALTGGLLAIAVIYLFLRNFRSTVVIALSIPISIITTFTIIYFSGLTLNMMSLSGLALGVGMLVDDAIVVLENIYRHRQLGKNAYEAAAFGAGEMTLAVVASTLSTIVVFLPIVFVQGMASQFFKEMALTVSFSLLASLGVSLTLVPYLSSRLLTKTVSSKSEETSQDGILARIQHWWGALEARYRQVLIWALGNRKKTLALSGAVLAASLALLPFIGMEFVPRMDTGEFKVNVTMPNGTVLAETEKVVRSIEAMVSSIPEVETVYTTVGAAPTGGFVSLDNSGSDTGMVAGKLLPLGRRRRSLFEVIEEIRAQAVRIPSAKVTVTVSGGMAGMSGAPIAVQIKGDDLQSLKNLAAEAVRRIRNIPGTREVDSSLAQGRPEAQIRINREKASGYGLSVNQVAGVIRSAVQGQVATKYRVGGNEYDVKVRASESARGSMAALSQLLIPAPNGAQIPLADLAVISEAVGPNSVDRQGQARVVTVSSDLEGRDLNSVVEEIRAALSDLPLPPGYRVDYSGQAQQMEEAFGDLGMALILAIVLTYLVMAAQFESFLHPFTIMFSVPLASVGVILGLAITGRSLDVSAFIGLIMLVGIVVKNAIVLIDYINTLRSRGAERTAAVSEAGPIRLRPVLMTTLTTVLGMVPLALGIGDGSEQQAPMATVVIGGLMLSTFLTLVVIPVLYTVFDDMIGGRPAEGETV